ncbi:MAG TPA: PEP-CTERM sorting domain-containing protein [Casimicrobiaceae bacterium]|nr:PEP-CTERM sorting domain-containing protein [Casimicrobiaceae bacterium]
MSRRVLTTYLGVLAAIMIWGAPAQAKTIGSSFDPDIFSGVGTFFVPDPPGSDCLTQGIGFHAVNGYNSCKGVVLESASLTAKDTLGDTFVLSLPPPTPNANAVTGMVLNPAASPIVVGFNTIEIPITQVSCSGPSCHTNTWDIQWLSGLPREDDYEYDGNGWNPLAGLNNQVLLFENGNKVGTATHVAFTPEPGSLGLLLGALGAGWLARRRKAAA